MHLVTNLLGSYIIIIIIIITIIIIIIIIIIILLFFLVFFFCAPPMGLDWFRPIVQPNGQQDQLQNCIWAN
jgi:hypothetical protein